MEILLGLIISLLALWILARFVIAVFSGIAGIFGGQSHKSNSNDSTLPQSFGNTSASRHGTDEDDLRSFRISQSYHQTTSKNKTPGRWVPVGESLTIGNIEITGGFFYTGGRLASLSYDGDTEASLVDPSLKIEPKPLDFTDDSLGYWPKFSSISPQCRGAFIQWLASERSAPKTPLGYVFIYFYGLERRALIDGQKGEVTDEEYLNIFKEILRLKAIYGFSGSFMTYASRLLEIMTLFRPKVVKLPASEWDTGNYDLLVRVQLAKLVTSGRPIPARLALLWLHLSETYRLRTPARRCNQEFAELFKAEYARKWGDGMNIKPNKTQLKIEYRAASSTLRGIELTHKDLVDPSRLKGPMNKLAELADYCTAALEAYSRYLGKQGNSRDDVAAMLLLPETLSSTSTSPFLKAMNDWGQEKIRQDQGVVTVSEFFAKTKQPLPDKLLKKDLELIQGLMQKIGFGFAPDPRYHNAKPSADGKIVLFPEGHGEHFEARPAFIEVGLALRLGVMVAGSDGHVDDHELLTLHRLIDHNHDLSPTEQLSLHAYLKWRVSEQSSSMAGLAARLKELGQQEKTAVAHILVKVALADGRVEPDEIKQLEKMYQSLGLDKAQVSTDIHALSSSRSGEIKTSTQPATGTTSAGFALDELELARHESETKHAQTMLGAIFASDDAEQEIQEEAETEVPPAQVVAQGLDAAHSTLFKSLITQANWSRDAIEGLCKPLGLMVDGAIETINDWAFELVDAPLIDEDGDFFVDLEVAEELSDS